MLLYKSTIVFGFWTYILYKWDIPNEIDTLSVFENRIVAKRSLYEYVIKSAKLIA